MIRRRVLPVLMFLLFASLAHAQPPRLTPPPSSAQNPSFNLVNRTTSVIKELFVTPSGSPNWGQNRLDGKSANPNSIAPGATYAVRRRLDTNCVFDIRVVFADGRHEERRGVNTCAVEEVTVGTAPTSPGPGTGKAADDPSIRLFNRAAVPVVEFYATPAGLNHWGQNRLDKSPLPPDTTRMVALPRDGNCIYDLRVVFADKRSMEKKRSNLCRVTELPVP